MDDYNNGRLSNPKEVEHAYADFLMCFPWDYYSTVTFRQTRHDGIQWAKRIWNVFDKFDASRVFVAIEPNTLDGIHAHLLSRHLPVLQTTGSLWKYLYKAFGRSQVEAITGIMPVSRYCAKYVVKRNQFEFFGDKSAWLLDK